MLNNPRAIAALCSFLALSGLASLPLPASAAPGSQENVSSPSPEGVKASSDARKNQASYKLREWNPGQYVCNFINTGWRTIIEEPNKENRIPDEWALLSQTLYPGNELLQNSVSALTISHKSYWDNSWTHPNSPPPSNSPSNTNWFLGWKVQGYTELPQAVPGLAFSQQLRPDPNFAQTNLKPVIQSMGFGFLTAGHAWTLGDIVFESELNGGAGRIEFNNLDPSLGRKSIDQFCWSIYPNFVFRPVSGNALLTSSVLEVGYQFNLPWWRDGSGQTLWAYTHGGLVVTLAVDPLAVARKLTPSPAASSEPATPSPRQTTLPAPQSSAGSASTPPGHT